MNEQLVYGNRNPNENDWKTCPSLYVNLKTDELFVKGSKGWLKIPTEYEVLHNQPERLNPETCDHSGIRVMQHMFSSSYKCTKCGSIFYKMR